MKKKFNLLELGAGERYTEGFSRQDVDPSIRDLDLVCPAEEIDKYVEENSVKYLRATHLLEHFPTKQIPFVLDAWYKVLAPGGELYMEMPNFLWNAKYLLEEGNEEQAVNYAFGEQLDEWDFHKTGFTPNIIRKRLLAAGFIDTMVEEDSSMRIWTYKPNK